MPPYRIFGDRKLNCGSTCVSIKPLFVGSCMRDTLIVDPWNCFGIAQVFAYAAEAAEMAGTAVTDAA